MITCFTQKEFAYHLTSSAGWCNYYKTPAGILKVFSVETGAYKAEFVEDTYLDENSFFIDKMPNLLLVGTSFQIKVWQAALQIPSGTTVSYQDFAKSLGASSASRAVARTLAHNNIAYFIPCHRVVGKNGKLCGYKWGIDKKATLLTSEKLLRQ